MTEPNNINSARAEWPLLLAVVLVVAACNFCTIIDYDIWFHIKSGEYYWNTKSLPHTDPFTFAVPEGTRDVSEWLSELLMFIVWSLGGSLALQLANTLVLALTFLLLYRLIRLRGCVPWLAFAMTLVAIFVARPRWMPRPYQLVNLGIVLLFWIVERWKREDRPLPRPWLFALYFFLWSNLHPGAYSGLALLGLFWLDSRFTSKKMPLSVPLAAFIGSLLNADLPGQAHKVLTCMTRGNVLQNVLEHMPPGMDRIVGWFGVFLFLVLAAFPRMLRKKRWLDSFLVAGIVFYSFRSRRYIDLLAIIAAPPVAEAFSDYLRLLSWKPKEVARKVSVAILVVVILSGGFLSLCLDESHQFGLGVDWSQLPVKAVEKAQELGLTGHCFCIYAWGGYVSYIGYPDWKVFIDGRCLMYGAERMQAYFDILHAKDWQSTFDKYDIQFVLIDSEESGGGEGPVKQPNISDSLFESSDWMLVYWNDNSRLYIRKSVAPEGTDEFYFVNPNQPTKSIENADERQLQNVENELRRVLADSPETVTALNLMGTIMMNRGDPKKAEQYFRQAIAVPNATGGVYINLGLSLLLQNRLDEALKHLEHAAQLGMDDPGLYLQIAEVHRHLGHDREAETWRKKAEDRS